MPAGQERLQERIRRCPAMFFSSSTKTGNSINPGSCERFKLAAAPEWNCHHSRALISGLPARAAAEHRNLLADACSPRFARYAQRRPQTPSHLALIGAHIARRWRRLYLRRNRRRLILIRIEPAVGKESAESIWLHGLPSNGVALPHENIG